MVREEAMLTFLPPIESMSYDMATNMPNNRLKMPWYGSYAINNFSIVTRIKKAIGQYDHTCRCLIFKKSHVVIGLGCTLGCSGTTRTKTWPLLWATRLKCLLWPMCLTQSTLQFFFLNLSSIAITLLTIVSCGTGFSSFSYFLHLTLWPHLCMLLYIFH